MDREEMIRRLDSGEDPLEVEIVSWENNRHMEPCNVDVSASMSALCQTQPIVGICSICVVFKHTGAGGCYGTPYSDYVQNPTKYNAGRMVMFLKSLREE